MLKKPTSVRIALLLSAALGGVSLAQDKAALAPKPAAAGELIPRQVLFGNPDRANVQLSHDGKSISYLAPVNGVLNVWVAPIDEPAKAKAVTSDTNRGIRTYYWAYDNAHLLYTQDQGGDENWKVYSVDLKAGTTKDLTPFDHIDGPDGKPIMLPGPEPKPLRPAAQIQEVSDKFPSQILIAINNRNPQYHDLYRADLGTGELTLVRKNDEYAGFITDDNFKVRVGVQQTEDGGQRFDLLDESGKASELATVGMEDALTTGPAGFDKTGNVLYMNESRGRDTAALAALDLTTRTQSILAEDSRADVGGALVHPTSKTIQAVEFTYDRTTWKVLDASIQPDLDYLKTVANGEVNVTSRTQDDTRWIVAYTLDNGPVRYYRYDRPSAGDKANKAGKATFLFTNRASIENLPLARMHPVVIKSRDGMNLVSYLTLPAGSDADNNGRPDNAAAPLVLFVHGGPWARDEWGYNPYHQWLANRGYAVLSVNYRGSTGFGKAFINAGNKEWAGKMHDDLIDAVNWTVEQRIALKDKVAIMGGSYGGYATLVGLTFTPDVFACGVDIVGPSSITTLLNTIPPYWAPLIETFTTRVGDHRTEEGRAFLASRSPLTFIDKIKKPLLIGQGANDPRVKQSESDQIVSAMQGKGIPVTYVLFPDEGHGFRRPENNTAFNAITEAFLAQNLGGRCEPYGQDITKSTAQIKAGAEFVPGLSLDGAPAGAPAPAAKGH